MAFVALMGSAAGVAAAPAARYVCAVPRALLCERCAAEMTIALLPGGGCRISFTPPVPDPDMTTSPTAPAVERFSFAVISPLSAIGRRIAPRAWRAQAARARRALEAKPVQSRCFAFNGNSYCE